MRERIINCTLNLFLRHGIKAVTMDDIARDLGISKRTLYEYFDNKDAILIECINSRIEQEELFCKTELGLLDLLLDYFRRIEKLYNNVNCRCLWDIRKYHSSIYSFLTVRIAGYAMIFKEKVNEGIENGYIRKDTTPDLVYVALLEHLSKLFYDSERCVQNISKGDLMAQTILVFARGISTIKGRAYIDNRLKIREINEIY